MNTFTMNNYHVKLLRHMYVGWCNDEFGAPEIDPKRPYGNSDVQLDISEILGWEVPDEEEDFEAYSAWQDKTWEIHKETQTALQIVLVTGSFAPGTYMKTNQHWDARNWVRVPETDEEKQFVEEALNAAESGSAGHWPTVAAHLADEVRRLRQVIDNG